MRRSPALLHTLTALTFAWIFSSSNAHAEVLQASIANTSITVQHEGGRNRIVVPNQPTVDLPDGNVRFERIRIGASEALIVHVATVAVAVLHASARSPARVVFAGSLQQRDEDTADTIVRRIVHTDVDGDGHAELAIAERRSSETVCGLPDAFSRANFLAEDGSWHPIAWDPLAPALTSTATQASPAPTPRTLRASPPEGSAPVFVAQPFIATPRSTWNALVDRSDSTAWNPRAGALAYFSVGLGSINVEQLVLRAPPAPARLPPRITVVLEDRQVLDVAIPDPTRIAPGTNLTIPIVPARALRCFSLIFPRGTNANAAIAEVALHTALDSDPNAITTLVQALGGAHGEELLPTLQNLGDRAVTALQAQLPELRGSAARRALRVLAGIRTAASANLLARLLGRPELTNEARASLQHMGPLAIDALGAAALEEARAAEVLASFPGPEAPRLRALLPTLHTSDAQWRSVRRAVRSILANNNDAVTAWLQMLPSNPSEASRALAIAHDATSDSALRTQISTAARAIQSNEFADRFRLLGPLSGAPEGRAMVEETLASASDDDLRAEAARSLTGISAAREALVRALRDRVPRVRAAAATALVGMDARTSLEGTLQRDTWPSVRAAAATALEGDSAAIPALIRAMDDPSVLTVRAVFRTLARAAGAGLGTRFMTFAEDLSRNPQLREEALDALAQRCERGFETRLLALFNRQNDPVLPPPEQAVAHAALAALARIDGPRALAELRRMEANAQAIAAVERAARGGCNRAP